MAHTIKKRITDKDRIRKLESIMMKASEVKSPKEYPDLSDMIWKSAYVMKDVLESKEKEYPKEFEKFMYPKGKKKSLQETRKIYPSFVKNAEAFLKLNRT